jgi:hypothetical protein
MWSNLSLAAQPEALLIGEFPLTEAFANNATVHLRAKALLSPRKKSTFFHSHTCRNHLSITILKAVVSISPLEKTLDSKRL